MVHQFLTRAGHFDVTQADRQTTDQQAGHQGACRQQPAGKEGSGLQMHGGVGVAENRHHSQH